MCRLGAAACTVSRSGAGYCDILRDGRKILIRHPKVTSLPLVVDFEHGLLSCDLGVEATFALAKVKPLHALGTVLRFASGSGSAIAFVERHQHIDATGLPYNEPVLAL